MQAINSLAYAPQGRQAVILSIYSCAEVGTNIASSALRQLLNPQDAMLGPWVPGRDPQEDALTHFAGAPGGPAMHPWQIGHGADATANESTGTS